MAHAKHHGGAHIKLVAFPCEDASTTARYDVPAPNKVDSLAVNFDFCCLNGINSECCGRMQRTSSIMHQDNQSH